MQIVIDIPKYVYDTIVASDGYIQDCDNEKVGMAVKDSTPLPKGCDVQRIIPKKVDVQKWIYTDCPNPNCNHKLSVHYGDGYYSIEHQPDFCPDCGQALIWESEG